MKKFLLVIFSSTTFALADEVVIVNDYIQLPGNPSGREPVSPFKATPTNVYRGTKLEYAIVKYKRISAEDIPGDNIFLSSIPNNIDIKYLKDLVQLQKDDVVKGKKEQVPLALELFSQTLRLGSVYFFNTQDYKGGSCFLVYPSPSYDPSKCVGMSNVIIDLHKYLLFFLHRASIAYDILGSLANASNEEIAKIIDLLKDKQKLLTYIENEGPKEFTINLLDIGGGSGTLLTGVKFEVVETSPSTQRVWEVVLDGTNINISSNGLGYIIKLKQNIFRERIQLKESGNYLFFTVDQNVQKPYIYRIADYTTNSYITSGVDILPLVKKYKEEEKKDKKRLINLDEVFK